MASIKLDLERCKECHYCIKFCPVDAISIDEGNYNKKGFEVVKVDEDKCIYCGTCYTVCPDVVFTIKK